jgi:hypothetical protein
MLLKLYTKLKCVSSLLTAKEAVTKVDINFPHYVKKLVCENYEKYSSMWDHNIFKECAY